METVWSAKAWATVWQYRVTFLNGLLNTLQSAVVGLLIAMAIGFALGLMATGSVKGLRMFARAYVEFFQNTPLILQVCFLYYALAYSGVKITVVTVGFISLGLYHGAYVAEVVRAGIQSIPLGQFDAARAQGFGTLQTMTLIVLPQAFRNIIPTLLSQMITTIKDSSYMASLVTVELMGCTKLIISKANSYNGTWVDRFNRGTIHVTDVFVLFGFAFLVYFAINFTLSCFVRRMRARRRA